MVIGAAVIELHLPGVRSLKEKRGILKSLIARLHKEFNASCGEIDHHDTWQSASLGVAVVSNSASHAEQMLDGIVRWIERHRPDVQVVDHSVEIIR